MKGERCYIYHWGKKNQHHQHDRKCPELNQVYCYANHEEQKS